MTRRMLFLSLALGIAICAGAQDKAIAVHPTPSDLARALETVDIVYARINGPLITVSTALSQADTANNQQHLMNGVQELAHQWAGILTASNGREMPKASDLFFIYTNVLDVQSYVESVANEPNLQGQPGNVLQTATTLLRADTELIPAVQVLRNAVADRIDVEETECNSGKHR